MAATVTAGYTRRNEGGYEYDEDFNGHDSRNDFSKTSIPKVG
jgi:hypothetical protein